MRKIHSIFPIFVVFSLVGLVWATFGGFPFDKISLIKTPDGSENTYYKDRLGNSVYWGFNQELMVYKKIDIDSKKISVINNNYAKDDRRVFFQDRVIRGADISSFNAIPQQYEYVLNDNLQYEKFHGDEARDGLKQGEFAIDSNNIYFNDTVLQKNQYKLIKNIATNILVADSDIFISDQLKVADYPGLDASSLQPYSTFFFADKDRVYCVDVNSRRFYPLVGMDRAKFRYYKTLPGNQYFYVYGDGNLFYYFNGGCIPTQL